MYVAGCGNDSEKEGCQNDYDCREPRVCVRGYCEGSEGEGEGEDNICDRYLKNCPFAYDYDTGKLTDQSSLSSKDYGLCVEYCVMQGQRDMELCGFIACAVETGYCDNEVQEDLQIIACMKRHGWDK